MTTSDPIATLLEKVGKAHVAMVSTTGPDGKISSRPLVIQEVAGDHAIWFLTRQDASVVDGSTAGQQVNVTVAEKGFWASIAGTAEVVRDDDDRKREYWGSATEAFYGSDTSAEDPEIVLVRVQPQSAEYWDSPGLPATVVELVKSKVTGHAARPGDSQKVDF